MSLLEFSESHGNQRWICEEFQFQNSVLLKFSTHNDNLTWCSSTKFPLAEGRAHWYGSYSYSEKETLNVHIDTKNHLLNTRGKQLVESIPTKLRFPRIWNNERIKPFKKKEKQNIT